MHNYKNRVILTAAVAAALVLAGLISHGRAADAGAHVDSVASADGVMIHYDVRGTGDHGLVFVHGWSCDRGYWDGQADEFAKTCRVVTLDLAGHGESGMGRKDYTMPAYGADVAAVVNKLGLNDVILVGHSMGGAVCLEAARLLKGKVKAIVGVDTYQDFSMKMDSMQVRQMIAQFKQNFTGTTEMFVKSMFPPSADSGMVDKVAKDMASEPQDVGVSSLEHLFSYDPVETLNEVRVPIRCINSDHFPTNVDGNKKLAASFEVKYMPGRGHFLFMEDSATFNKLLHETLNEFWPAGQ